MLVRRSLVVLSIIAVAWSLASIACSSGTAAAPTTPSQAAASPTPATYTLRGTVRAVPTANASSGAPVGVPDVHVQVLDGPNAGKSTDTGSDGAYQLSLLAGGLTVSATKNGYQRKDISLTLSASTTQDIDIKQVCDPWPSEASEILAKLTMPNDLCFVQVSTPAVTSFYSAVARTVFVRVQDLAGGNVVRHELGHAHQHRVILEAGLPDPRFDDTFVPRWVMTPEGDDFIRLTGWRLDAPSQNAPSFGWIEKCESGWSCGYPNPIEDSAQFTADYFGPASPSQLQVRAPLRFQWASRWLKR